MRNKPLPTSRAVVMCKWNQENQEHSARWLDERTGTQRAAVEKV